MRSGEVLRRHLRQNRAAVEQHDATLEIPLGLEFGIACRIESFDERNLFGGYKFLSKCNDLHGDTSFDDDLDEIFRTTKNRHLSGIGRIGNRSGMVGFRHPPLKATSHHPQTNSYHRVSVEVE
jgi:hypothetical protein